MIKLTRPDEPEYLAEKRAGWTTSLLQAVEAHGSYQAIPQPEKTRLVSYYLHDKIREPLFAAAFYKCAFCESKPADGGSAVQVEHFYPKSRYPKSCFSWENFLPACGKCNQAKSDLDTKVTAIINPYEDDPQMLLSWGILKLKPLSNNAKARATIREIRLNSDRLLDLRRDLLSDIEKRSVKLGVKIEEYEAANDKRQMESCKFDLEEFVAVFEDLMKPEQSHSFFCTEIISEDEFYLRAKSILTPNQ
ncbi:MAG: hypothetical protein ACI8WB_005067 [Phenylobacterium sp.]|jgi:uncharacterized protein (TIGR02646 family)